ncbi:MAG: hypothetical protein RL173_3606 [Fibrobacterota bacterium]|jgi:hypothetical protein
MRESSAAGGILAGDPAVGGGGVEDSNRRNPVASIPISVSSACHILSDPANALDSNILIPPSVVFCPGAAWFRTAISCGIHI